MSQGKTATQSSYFTQYPQWNADRLVDGIAGGPNSNQPQTKGRVAGRFTKGRGPLTDFNAIGNVFEYNNSSGMPVGYVQDITNLNLNGRYVSICVDNGATAFPLTLSEVKVYGCVSSSNPCLNNQNPSISISSSSSSYPRNSSFTISPSVNDPDGTISKVEFYNGTNFIFTQYRPINSF
ncbi:MAG: hypothetical protein IPK94_03510 [Saprospiraceae bacterium]|nr:hypothetical protein [Saprospiraceae bacterium]